MVKKNGSGQAAQKAETQPQESGLPLFFKKPRPLDASRHSDAGINADTGYGFAKATNSVPINAIEFIEAARYYPIVFTGDDAALPVVLVGLEQENYFVDKAGKWAEDRYIPAYVRKYPFVFMDVAAEQKFYLCIDEDAPHFQAKKSKSANPLYEDGKVSQLTNNALEFCTAYHKQFEITRNFAADLKKHDLLVSNQSDITLNDGRKMRLGGFLLIDETKFNQLSDEAFMEFRKKGWLPFVYFALASLSNWRHLANLAAEQGKK